MLYNIYNVGIQYIISTIILYNAYICIYLHKILKILYKYILYNVNYIIYGPKFIYLLIYIYYRSLFI